MLARLSSGLGLKLKIVLVSQNASPGLLVFRKDFIKFLVGKGYEVFCFSNDYTENTKSAVRVLGAIPVDYRLDKTGFNPFSDIVDIFLLARKINSIKPDIVFSFFVKPSIYGTLAAKLAAVPRRIAMLEGLGYLYTSTKTGLSFRKKVLQRIHGFLCSVGYFYSDKVLFLNPDDPIDLSKVSLVKKDKVINVGPIGLELSEYRYMPVKSINPIRFIFIARLLKEKGVFEYLEAARLVKKEHPDAEFVVLGGLDNKNPSALSKQQLEDVIAENLVIYPGHVSDVPSWINDSHVFVLPSYREGFPRSTQEAMAIGRAVITTDVPGCRETVVDGVNGFLVPPWDVEALANKMVYFIQNQEEIKRMGDESHRIAVERFDIHKINPVLARITTGVDE